MDRNSLCWCGSKQKWKRCHYPERAVEESSKLLAERYKKQFGILLKSREQIEGIRQASQLAALILHHTVEYAQAGVTSNQLNQLAHELHLKHRAIPACLHYGSPPFPKSICTSLNEVICHGIPDDRPLVEGDILNIDITTLLGGYYGDCSAMVSIGEINEEKKRVIEASYHSLLDAIAVIKPGVPISDIGKAIEARAESYNCSVVEQYVGHGVGLSFHEPPQIPHYKNHITIPLAEGMTFTVEPMINAGVPEGIIDPRDKWSCRTADGKASAQWEHTLLVTKEGCEILTLYPAPSSRPSH